MTTPTITYGHGFCDDCNKLTGLTYGSWTETDTGTLLAESVAHDDYFVLVRSAGAAEAYLSYPDEGGANNLSLSTTVYTRIFWRYQTSNSNVKAKIVLVFTGAEGTQTVLDETSSTSFTTGSATITSGKTIDHIRLYANSAAGTINYDFVLICKNVFAFPNTIHGLEFTPPPRYANIEIPSRVTDITQNLGSRSATVRVGCNLDRGLLDTTIPICAAHPTELCGDDWKRPQGVLAKYQTDKEKGEVFLDIAHNSYAEPFQWLDTGKYRFKVTLEEPVFREQSNEHTLDLLFREYSRSSKSNESYAERFSICPVGQHWDSDASKCVDDA